MFIFIYCYLLVGPQISEIIVKLILYLSFFILVLGEMCWGAYILFIAINSTICFLSPIWWLGVIIVGIFVLFLVGFILFLIIIGVMRCTHHGLYLEGADDVFDEKRVLKEQIESHIKN